MKPLRKIKTDKSQIFLTFDDGPDPDTTPFVLDALDELNAKGTFFIIGNLAEKYPAIVSDLLKRGHSLGDHSMDHQYAHFFRKEEHLKDWISDSQVNIREKFGVEPVGFRSPAGVVTPPLMRAIQDLNIPWVHWNHRFFDTSFPLSWTGWTYTPQGGDILLLHDGQRSFLRKGFQRALRNFLLPIKDKGFDFPALTKDKF